MWDEIAAEVAQGFPDVTWDKMLVDAMTVRMTMKPQSIDTVVATNLHAAKLKRRVPHSPAPMAMTKMKSRRGSHCTTATSPRPVPDCVVRWKSPQKQ